MNNFNVNSEETTETPSHGKLERIAGMLMLALAFLLPIFFIPSATFPFQFSKSLLLSVVVLGAFCLWVIARLKDGEFYLPRSPLLVSLGAIVGLFTLSSLFSGSLSSSFIGSGFEVGTTVNILIVIILTLLVPIIFRTKEQMFWCYLAFLASFFLIALFQLLRLVFGPDFLSAGIFTDAVSNTVGKWNDLGIFFGASALLSLVTIEFLSLGKLFRTLIFLSLIISLFFLAIINFSTVWFVLGIFSLVFLVYLISFRKEEKPLGEEILEGAKKIRAIPFPSLSVLIISVLFILAGSSIGNQITEFFKISQIEARPSWQATFDVARQTLIQDPLLGAGPNQFTGEWLRFKPAGINQTIFWNVDFDYGVGLIPTFLATSGILGVMAWLAFFLLFLMSGFKAILAERADKFSQYLVTSSFLVAFFLWIFNVFYIPSQTIFVLTFLFTGLFIAALSAQGIIPKKTISFSHDPRAGFVSVLVLILLLTGGVTLGYLTVQKYVAAVYFQKGIISLNNEGNLDKGERLIARAASLSPQDLYFRFLSEIGLMRINALLSQNANEASAESVRGQFQNLLGASLQNAREALQRNPSNYQNFMQLGRIYEAVVPLGIAGAYESARGAYEQALLLNPHGPSIILTLARLEIAKDDKARAREYIARALQEKGNYTEAIFLLSQLEVLEGNIKAAISSVEAASVIAPNDPTIFFQLGLLRFNDKEYRGAVSALERAVALNGNYANAKYFLGLSYEKLNRDAEAIGQFTDLKTANPDNEEINLILSNLRAGRSPFSNAAPPVDDKPEKRAKLPVEEAEE